MSSERGSLFFHAAIFKQEASQDKRELTAKGSLANLKKKAVGSVVEETEMTRQDGDELGLQRTGEIWTPRVHNSLKAAEFCAAS